MEIISPEKLLLKVVPILDKLKINYFITGGFAVSAWGRPRATFDIDIVIKIIETRVEPLVNLLKKISEQGYIDRDTTERAVREQGEFNFIDPDTGLKVDFWVAKEDEQINNEFSRRIVKKISNKKIYFISPEDLILNKIEWYKKTNSDRHLEDIDSIFRVSGKKLNRKYLTQQAKKLGFLGILKQYL